MKQILVAGVDTSTQSCKVRVTDAQTGALVRFGQAPHPEGSSVDPEAWWQAFLQAAHEAGGLDDISAIAVGGQQHGMIVLDQDGEVIRPALLWNDTRSAPQAEELILNIGKNLPTGTSTDAIDMTADPLEGKQHWVKAVGSSPVASLTITKLAWINQEEPEHVSHIAAVCLPHDWLSWRIAGHGPRSSNPPQGVELHSLFTDRSDASGTGYFDSNNNCYRRDLLAMALPRDIAQQVYLPRVLQPHEVGSKADSSIAGKNIPGGCLIAAGGGDNAMAAMGLSMEVGDVSISLGTSGVAAAVSPVPAYDMTGAVTGFADATGHWLPLACTINASRILDAGRATLAVSYEELATLANQSQPGAQGITLIPYFDGERTPNRPQAKGRLEGMTLANSNRANIARAFIEGLLCSQKDCLELLKRLGTDIKRILLVGGGVQSPAVQAYAPGIFGMDVQLPRIDQYVAIGAARQAAWALTQNPDPPQWPVNIESVLTGSPTPEVYEQYVHWRR